MTNEHAPELIAAGTPSLTETETPPPPASGSSPPAEPRDASDQRNEFAGWFRFAVAATAVFMIARQSESERETRDEVRRLEEQGPPRIPPRAVARRPISPAPTAWGVTTRPTKITYDFCFRFAYQTTPTEQKRIVPSGSSRSQYIRIGKLIPDLWGRALDERRTSFEKLRWVAAPDDLLDRQDRSQRVLAGEHPQELLKQPKSRRRGAPGTGGKVAAVAAPYRITEEDFQRAEATLKAMGQEIRLPRDAQDVHGEAGTKGTANGSAPPKKRKRKPRVRKAPARKPGRVRRTK